VLSALCVLHVSTPNSFHAKPPTPILRPIRDSPTVFCRGDTHRRKIALSTGNSSMPQYTPSASIAPPWSASMSMQASIILDQPGNVSFTNLDVISGRVVVRCSKSVDISTIVVKLEGESRTRLMSATGPDGERPKPQLEYHKVGDPYFLMVALTDHCRFYIKYRWSFRHQMCLKGETGRHLRRVPTHYHLARTSIPGSSK
jgi:hypothetical protein